MFLLRNPFAVAARRIPLYKLGFFVRCQPKLRIMCFPFVPVGRTDVACSGSAGGHDGQLMHPAQIDGSKTKAVSQSHSCAQAARCILEALTPCLCPPKHEGTRCPLLISGAPRQTIRNANFCSILWVQTRTCRFYCIMVIQIQCPSPSASSQRLYAPSATVLWGFRISPTTISSVWAKQRGSTMKFPIALLPGHSLPRCLFLSFSLVPSLTLFLFQSCKK